MDPRDDSTQSTEKKKVRGPTRMKNVISRRLHADKLPIDIDPTTGKVTGDLASQFISTMRVYALTKVSILLPT